MEVNFAYAHINEFFWRRIRIRPWGTMMCVSMAVCMCVYMYVCVQLLGRLCYVSSMNATTWIAAAADDDDAMMQHCKFAGKQLKPRGPVATVLSSPHGSLC